MKEYNFNELKINKYKIGDYLFDDDFTYEEMMTMSSPEGQTSLIDILNRHRLEGPVLEKTIKFKKIKFITEILIKGFLESMGT